MQGGIFYQLLFLHSWGIYTIWLPRTLYPFSDYFFSATYFIGIGFFYFFTFYLFLKANKNKFFFLFLISLIISLFLSKGAQDPFGNLFLYLYENLPGFTVFRTPDIRFGFTTQMCYFILFSLYVNKVKFQSLFLLSISLILISFPLFNGSAVNGQNIAQQYSDRKFNFTEDEITVQNYINSVNQDKSAYFITYPSLVYGKFNRYSDKFYIGPDPFSKILDINSAYISSHSGMQTKTYSSFKHIYSNIDLFKEFPIKYIIVRNDTDLKIDLNVIQFLKKHFNKVFKNNTYTVYENSSYSGIIKGNDISLQSFNITDFSFRSKYIQENIQFNLQYSKNYKLFFDDSCDDKLISDLGYFRSIYNYFFNFKSQLMYTHLPSTTNFNTWILNRSLENNKKNCYSYSIIYVPQLIYFALLLLSLFTFLFLIIFYKKELSNNTSL
jgi:hypothetical protein